MRSGWLLAGIAGGLGWVRLVGCSVPECFYGTWPYDGQTGVPVDAVVTFAEDGPLPADLPALAPGISLTRVDGGNPVAVPFDVRVDVAGGLIEIVPREPLAADAEYEVSGVDNEAISTAHYWAGLERSAKVRFATRSDPTLLEAQRLDDGSVVLVFSEPVAVEEIGSTLALNDAGDAPVVGVVVGLWEAEPHLVVVDDGGLASQVSFAEGPSVPIADGVEVGEILDGYRSLPTCRYE